VIVGSSEAVFREIDSLKIVEKVGGSSDAVLPTEELVVRGGAGL